jgi:glucose/mannose-6-phosphate isomerase
MLLDDRKEVLSNDPGGMLDEIDRLPEQIKTAWDIGKEFSLRKYKGIEAVIISGMGGSAIGADLLCAWVNPIIKIPFIVCRDYTLPAWFHGKQNLLITISHSGNTEETLAVFQEGAKRDCSMLAISTGGMLANKAKQIDIDLWRFQHEGQPRAAVGYSFILLLVLFYRLGLLPNPEDEICLSIEALKAQQEDLTVDIPLIRNPAKRLAGQLIGRFVTVFGAEHMAPVARRWKTQLNELAKAWCGFETLPEADHNTIAGTENPQNLLMNQFGLFIEAPSNHPRNLLRSEITRQMMMECGIGVDKYVAFGESALTQIWTALHFGDYLAFYLATAYQIDPTGIPALDNLKNYLRSHHWESSQ